MTWIINAAAIVTLLYALMMHPTSIRHYKRSIALVFAFSILAVIGCDVVCAVNNSLHSKKLKTFVSFTQKEGKHNSRNYESESSKNRHLDCGRENVTCHPSGDPRNDRGDCCKNATAQFYSSLYQNSGVTILKAPDFVVLFLANIFSHKNLSENFSYVSPALCSLKIPVQAAGNSLRILISSFLI